MYRRFRLSTHRKNEFRKHREAKKQKNEIVTRTPAVEHVSCEQLVTQRLPERLQPDIPLTVSIRQDLVSVLRVSVNLDVYLSSPLNDFYQLRTRLQQAIIPQGNT